MRGELNSLPSAPRVGDAQYGRRPRKTRPHHARKRRRSAARPLASSENKSREGWGTLPPTCPFSNAGPMKIAASPLLTLDQRAVGRGRFPCPRVIDPGVAANDRSGPMLALEFGIVSERVMRHGGVRAEGHHL